jgi:electron transfer flavoprotein beta subunit
MKILVLMKMVPDVVEELEVADDGISLSREFLRLIISERDENAPGHRDRRRPGRPRSG